MAQKRLYYNWLYHIGVSSSRILIETYQNKQRTNDRPKNTSFDRRLSFYSGKINQSFIGAQNLLKRHINLSLPFKNPPVWACYRQNDTHHHNIRPHATNKSLTFTNTNTALKTHGSKFHLVFGLRVKKRSSTHFGRTESGQIYNKITVLFSPSIFYIDVGWSGIPPNIQVYSTFQQVSKQVA